MPKLTMVRLMERFNLFTSFYHLSEQRSRDDLIRLIIDCFDYTMCALGGVRVQKLLTVISDAHPRIVLAKALTSSYMASQRDMSSEIFAYNIVGNPPVRHSSPRSAPSGFA